MEGILEKLKNVAAALADEFAKGDERDDEKIAKLLADQAGLLATDEAKGYAGTDELTKQMAQLRKDIDANIEAVREMRRLGLQVRGGRPVVSGLRQRREMLADRRAFLDDDVARRFGAHAVVRLARTDKRMSVEDLPQRTREIADDVAKQAAQYKADPDIAPGASGAGAELVSDEFRAELIRNVEAVGTAYVLFRRVPLGTFGTSTWPKRTGGLTAYPTAIAAQITQSGIAFGTVTMTPEQWGTLTGVPMVMFKDPGLLADLGQLIGTEIVYAMADAFDNAVINGDGTADYGGITGMLQSANVAAVAPTADHETVATLDSTDVGEFIAGLTKGYALSNARWLQSLSVKGRLRNIRSTTGMPIYDRGVGGQEPATIDGYPYTLATRMPAASTITAGEKVNLFGDFRMYGYFGMLRQMEIASSEHVWFDQNMMAIRGIAYVDSAEADADAVIAAQTHA